MKQWFAGLLLLAMGSASVWATDDTILQVVVSTHPLARLVNSVSLPQQVHVDTLLAPGVTPHDAVLRPRQLQQLMDADLVVWMGAEVEPYLAMWMRKRERATLDIGALPTLLRLPVRKLSSKEHGHTHDAHYDIHLWWSQQNLLVAGNAIAERLNVQQPRARVDVEQRRQQFVQDMAQLAQQFAPAQADLPAFAVFHDGWQYLEHDLGQASTAGFVLDGELSMGVRHLAALKQHFDEHPVQCVLLEPGMSTTLVDKILPGTATVMLDPLGWDASGEGAVDMLRHAYVSLQSCGTKTGR